MLAFQLYLSRAALSLQLCIIFFSHQSGQIEWNLTVDVYDQTVERLYHGCKTVG